MKCCGCGTNLGMFKKYASLSDGGICKNCFERLGFNFNDKDSFSHYRCEDILHGYGYLMKSQTDVQEESDTIELFVAGYDFKQNELKSLLEYENDEYTLSKKDFLETVADRVYQFDTEYLPATIVHEDNEHDSNALAVYVDNLHIGYIARKDQKKVNLDNIAAAEVEIYGGKYKEINFDDYEETIVKGETPYKARLIITLKKEEL